MEKWWTKIYTWWFNHQTKNVKWWFHHETGETKWWLNREKGWWRSSPSSSTNAPPHISTIISEKAMKIITKLFIKQLSSKEHSHRPIINWSMPKRRWPFCWTSSSIIFRRAVGRIRGLISSFNQPSCKDWHHALREAVVFAIFRAQDRKWAVLVDLGTWFFPKSCSGFGMCWMWAVLW